MNGHPWTSTLSRRNLSKPPSLRRDLATQRNHPYVEPTHLLAGLLAQTDGLIYPILTNLDIHATDVAGPVDRALDAIPAVVGGSDSLSPQPRSTS